MSKYLKKVALIVCIQIIVYILLFVVYPLFWHTNIEILAIVIISGIVIVMYAGVIVKSNCNWMELLLGILPMWTLACLYHPNEIFGIGDGRTGLDAFSARTDALIFAVFLFVGQLIIKLFIKLYQVMKKGK